MAEFPCASFQCAFFQEKICRQFTEKPRQFIQIYRIFHILFFVFFGFCASPGQSPYSCGRRHGFDFQNLHRNKKSFTLNLKTEKGKEIFFELAKNADVIVENYRPRVKERLGIDYEEVRRINPLIVYGSISGFGQRGPYTERPGLGT